MDSIIKEIIMENNECIIFIPIDDITKESECDIGIYIKDTDKLMMIKCFYDIRNVYNT
jgi:hypothetical protein